MTTQDKCKFYKNCGHYHENDAVCNQVEGKRDIYCGYHYSFRKYGSSSIYWKKDKTKQNWLERLLTEMRK